MNHQKSRDRVQPFNYQSVQLGDSLFKAQFRETLEFYLSIPDDSLLHPFRTRSGLPAPGQTLGGWYGLGASTFGQKLGALAKMYVATGDQRLKEKTLLLADGWGECLASSDKVLKNGTYVYEKLLGGFADLYEYLDYQPALDYISALTDYAIDHFDQKIKRDGLQDSTLWEAGMIEWYTLPENLYRVYLFTKNQKYLNFAKVWDYDYFWTKILNDDPGIGPRHAYSHVNALSSAARAYEVTGDQKYLDIICKAYDLITEKHSFATGGFGPAECLFSENEGYMGDSLKAPFDSDLHQKTYRNFSGNPVSRDDSWGSCEIPCCAWSVFKICNYLIRFTGEAKYGDWVEKIILNGTLGQPPMKKDGSILYYSSYFSNGAVKSVDDRRIHDNGARFKWQCCTGTFPQDVAEYHNLIYYHQGDTLCVSQYLPSQIHWNLKGYKVTLTNSSSFPEEEAARFVINTDEPVEFTLKFRVPSWVNEKMTISVNDKKQDMPIKPDGWAEIRGSWKNGDRITLDMPYSLRFEEVDQHNPHLAALCFGPIVLASNEMALFNGDRYKPEEWIKPIPGEKHHFQTEPGFVMPYPFEQRSFSPFYSLGEMEWYYMYNRFHDANKEKK